MIARARTDQMIQQQRRAQPGLAVLLRRRNDGPSDPMIVDAVDLIFLPGRQDQRLPGVGTIGNPQKPLDKGDRGLSDARLRT